MSLEHKDFEELIARGADLSGILPSNQPSPPTQTIDMGFGGGLPAPELFPVAEIAEVADRVLRRDGSAALQYGGIYGFDGLRDHISEKIRLQDGSNVERSQVMITNGGAQALSLLCTAFLDPGDTIIVEAPTWAWLLTAMRTFQARVVPITVDEAGMDIGELESTLKDLRIQGVKPKLIYTIATFHNPAGVSMSSERRQKLVELAAEFRVLVVEDDTYGDLRYEGKALPSLLSMDDTGHVIKVGSFSKVLSSGLRVGWVVGHEYVIAAMASVRHDIGTSPFVQRTVAEYINAGYLGPHVRNLVEAYRAKRDTMIMALGEHCGPKVYWEKPEGGFFLWLTLAPEIDPDKLLPAATEEGVSYAPGRPYFTDDMGRDKIRMAFAAPAQSQIAIGVSGLARAMERAGR